MCTRHETAADAVRIGNNDAGTKRRITLRGVDIELCHTPDADWPSGLGRSDYAPPRVACLMSLAGGDRRARVPEPIDHVTAEVLDERIDSLEERAMGVLYRVMLLAPAIEALAVTLGEISN